MRGRKTIMYCCRTKRVRFEGDANIVCPMGICHKMADRAPEIEHPKGCFLRFSHAICVYNSSDGSGLLDRKRPVKKHRMSIRCENSAKNGLTSELDTCDMRL